jgi:hypothetical protein
VIGGVREDRVDVAGVDDVREHGLTWDGGVPGATACGRGEESGEDVHG